jgi:hypothetical protein
MSPRVKAGVGITHLVAVKMEPRSAGSASGLSRSNRTLRMQKTEYEQRLRAIDWGQLSGASADLFLEIASEEEEAANRALEEVLGHVCPQDVLEDAAPEVAAVLIQALQISGLAYPEIVLRGLVDLMRAAWTWPRPFGFLPRTQMFNGRPMDAKEVIAGEAAYDALSERLSNILTANLQVLCGLLHDNKPTARALAARLLALTAEMDSAKKGEEALDRAFKNESNETIRGGHLVSIAVIQRKFHRKDNQTLIRAEQAIRSQHTLAGVCGCTALLLLDAPQCLARHHSAIRDALTRERVSRLEFPWGDGYPTDLVAESLSISCASDEFTAELLIQALLHWIKQCQPDPTHPASWTVQAISTRLTERVFKEHLGRRDFIVGRELSSLQRSVVAKLMEFAPPALPTYAFSYCGFRDMTKDGTRLLRLVEGGLDLEMEGVWEQRRVSWPLWKWWHQAKLVDSSLAGHPPSIRDYVLARMRRQLSAREIWAAATDAVEGGYDVPHAPFVRLVAEVSDQLEPDLDGYLTTLDPGSDGKKVALAVVPILALLGRKPAGERVNAARKWSNLAHLIERITPAELRAEAIDLAGDPNRSQM